MSADLNAASGGGMTTLDTALTFPIRLWSRGRAGGGAVLAARVARVAHSRGCAEVLSFDMGGTTAKVCLIEDGEPRTSRAFEVGRAERFIKGSGLPATRACRTLSSAVSVRAVSRADTPRFGCPGPAHAVPSRSLSPSAVARERTEKRAERWPACPMSPPTSFGSRAP